MLETYGVLSVASAVAMMIKVLYLQSSVSLRRAWITGQECDARRIHRRSRAIVLNRLPHAIEKRCAHVEEHAVHPDRCPVQHIVELPQRGAHSVADTLLAVAGYGARLAHVEESAG